MHNPRTGYSLVEFLVDIAAWAARPHDPGHDNLDQFVVFFTEYEGIAFATGAVAMMRPQCRIYGLTLPRPEPIPDFERAALFGPDLLKGPP